MLRWLPPAAALVALAVPAQAAAGKLDQYVPGRDELAARSGTATAGALERPYRLGRGSPRVHAPRLRPPRRVRRARDRYVRGAGALGLLGASLFARRRMRRAADGAR